MSSISILIRHFNRAEQIEKCLSSSIRLKLPTHNHKPVRREILVIDDGSTSSQIKRLESIVDKFPDISLLKLNHVGPITALNRGIEKSKGEYFIILDSDDQLPINSLKNLWNPGFDYVYGDYLEIAPNGESQIQTTKDKPFNTIAGGILFRKAAVLNVGGYDQKLFFPEYDLLIKLGISKGKYVPEIVYHYHRSIVSLTASASRVLQGKQQLYKKYGQILPIRDYALMKKNIPNKFKVSITTALKSDIELILAWRSNPAIYKYFRQQRKPLTWEEHIAFWKSRKNRKDFMIVVKDKVTSRKIGTLNISRLETDVPEIGILIGEINAQGKGIGSAAVQLGLKWLKNHGYKKAQANINKANVASTKLFTSMDFVKNPMDTGKIWVNYEKYL